MFRKALLTVPLAGASLLWTAPAMAQPYEDPSSGLPSVCRVASWTSGGPCSVEQAPAYSRQGGQLARAILFFGGEGVQLVPTPPNATRTSAAGGVTVHAAGFVRPKQVPAFLRRVALY